MAANLRVDYPAMEAIAKQFLNDQNEINELLNQTKNKVETLHGNLWQGEAADKFFAEMENTVIPALGRLSNALGRASEATLKVSGAIKQADEDTTHIFIVGVLIG